MGEPPPPPGWSVCPLCTPSVRPSKCSLSQGEGHPPWVRKGPLSRCFSCKGCCVFTPSIFCAVLCTLSSIRLFATLWTIAHQAPLSMEFFRQKYCSGLPFSLPGDPPDPGIKLPSPVSPALADGFFTTETLRKPLFGYLHSFNFFFFNLFEG